MPYTPTVWNTGDTITATKINHLETQYAQAIADAGSAGDIKWAAYTSTPSGYLPCDGASLLRASYAALFSAIGTTFGAADGTHFNVPDLRGRTAIGAGTGSGLTNRTFGVPIGEEQHQLSIAEMPAHTHDRGQLDGDGTGGGSSFNPSAPNAGNGADHLFTASTGGDGLHNNMQPSLALNAYIKT